jgi:hypothetical protein
MDVETQEKCAERRSKERQIVSKAKLKEEKVCA